MKIPVLSVLSLLYILTLTAQSSSKETPTFLLLQPMASGGRKCLTALILH